MPRTLRTKVGQDFADAMREEDKQEKLAEHGRQLQVGFDTFVVGFTRSKKGNLWRRVVVRNEDAARELALTVFRQNDGYRLCIADSGGAHYGQSIYDNEQEALWGLWWGLRVHYAEVEPV
jgi:hypothetical protein